MPAGSLRTTRYTRPAFKRPVPRYHVYFFLFFFSPLPLPLISPRAFSHGVSFCLVPSPRGGFSVICFGCVWLIGPTGPLALRNWASMSRVKVPLAWVRMKKRVMHVLPRQMFMLTRLIRLFIANDALIFRRRQRKLKFFYLGTQL